MKFDHVNWLREFRSSSTANNNFRSLRAFIFQNTIKTVKEGGYELEGKKIVLDKICKDSVFYYKPAQIPNTQFTEKTKISVINADCLETAHLMQLAGYNPVVLNMANRQNPGGGVLGGAGAQEENIFRRSNIYTTLYQFVDYAIEYDLPRNPNHSYPMNRDTGGIYSPEATIFRGSENAGYCLLKKPYHLSFISVAAINNPELEIINGEFKIIQSLIEPTKEKIRTILRIAFDQQHDCLILSAMGCGAFRNPPNHIANMFNQVFNETEFQNKFKLIIFSIIDDHNAWKEHNPKGNLIPFIEEFE